MPVRVARVLTALCLVASLAAMGQGPCACTTGTAPAPGHDHCGGAATSGTGYRATAPSCACPCMRSVREARATLDATRSGMPAPASALGPPALPLPGAAHAVFVETHARPGASPPLSPPLVLRI